MKETLNIIVFALKISLTRAPEDNDSSKNRFDSWSIRNIEDLYQLLANNGPMILCVPLRYNAGHSVVIHGMTDTSIIYHDPLTNHNRLMSFEVLQQLYSTADMSSHQPFDIATLKPEFRNGIEPTFNTQDSFNPTPENLAIGKYKNYFTISKMQDPCKAAKDFLKNYTKTYFWQHRNYHQEKMQKFLEQHKKTTSLHKFMKALETDFGHNFDNDSSLNQRLQTVYKVMNQQHMQERTRPNTPASDIDEPTFPLK